MTADKSYRLVPLVGTHYLMIGRQPVVKHRKLTTAWMVRWLWGGSRHGFDLRRPW
jgi:hypothetical protein